MIAVVRVDARAEASAFLRGRVRSASRSVERALAALAAAGNVAAADPPPRRPPRPVVCACGDRKAEPGQCSPEALANGCRDALGERPLPRRRRP